MSHGLSSADGGLGYDEVKATLVEDDDSATVRGDTDSEHDDVSDAVDCTVSPVHISGDVSATLASAFGKCVLTGSDMFADGAISLLQTPLLSKVPVYDVLFS